MHIHTYSYESLSLEHTSFMWFSWKPRLEAWSLDVFNPTLSCSKYVVKTWDNFPVGLWRLKSLVLSPSFLTWSVLWWMETHMQTEGSEISEDFVGITMGPLAQGDSM